jgi:hypothetical protein
MTGKEFKEEKAKIQELRSFSRFDQARDLILLLIEKLFQERKFGKIVELFHSDVCTPQETFYIFEIAYSLNELGYMDESEKIYEYLLVYESNNTAILNNLSHIKRSKNQLRGAFELIRRAYKIVPQDEVIANNYHQLLAIIQEQEAIQKKYTNALNFLANENDFVTEKLQTFLSNIHRKVEFNNNRIPIPGWKFSELMETDQPQAEMLCEDWLEKGYLRDTGERSKQLVPIYELNPFLENELDKIEPKQLPFKWIEGFEELTVENLERFAYFSTLQKIRKIKKKYRDIAERDLNELFLNYLVKNEKAVIILSGSLVESVLLCYCEKKGITKLYLQRRNNKTEKRDLYECDLAEILYYLKEKKILGDIFVHVGNISRIYRNFIHPGKELREPELLNQTKSDLCFISALEIINTLL